MKKIIAVILTLAVAITAFPVPVSAASYKVTVSKSYKNGYTYVTLKPSSGTVYYTTDGTKADKNDKKYKSGTKIKLTKPVTLRMTVYSGGKAVKYFSEKISVKLKAPTISYTKKSDSKYTAKITATTGATIYYTTNGKTPTTSSKKLSGSTLTVSAGTTVRAIAVKKGWKNSSVSKKTAPKKASGGSDNSGSTEASESFEEEVLRLVNIERKSRGLSELTSDDKLDKAAAKRAKELTSLYSHDRPDGRDCFTVLDEFGISYSMAAENIAAGYATPKAVVEGWMNSPGHRANILKPGLKKLGVGYAKSDDRYRHYWVQLFIG